MRTNKVTKHAQTEMIKSYADNTDLAIFLGVHVGRWARTNPKAFMDYPYENFFACLPKYEEICLCWLNGGMVEMLIDEEWVECLPQNDEPRWRSDCAWMKGVREFRIKPKKEKRWICVTYNLEIEDGTLYESHADADENSPGYKQIVEIEVEVK